MGKPTSSDDNSVRLNDRSIKVFSDWSGFLSYFTNISSAM